ncbi:MAG TPA: hypothetical protein VG722_12775 [Tepidisphaeraceae bacterium]|nr:hypothetical protein [Tepidisphaeraceae bacterium]
MSDAPKPPSTLSEISHLFLSAIREKQGGPVRTPPTSTKQPVSVDLTPEEFAKVCAGEEEAAVAVPVTAILASHLDEPMRGVSAYAQHLAAHNQRVGIIEIDAAELRLSCLRIGANSDVETSAEPAAYLEPRHLAEAMEELNADVDRWLVVLKNPKLSESRSALRQISHWVLISACESEGVIAAYRSLKALSPLARPRLTVALLDGSSSDQVERVYHKIGSVCEQFLGWPVEKGPTVRGGIETAFQTIMHWHLPPEQLVGSAGPHWQVVEAFLSRARPDEGEMSPEEHQEILSPKISAVPSVPVAAVNVPCPDAHATPILSLTASGSASVLDAILQHHRAELIPCPVPLPMCEVGRLAVGRDRRLLLLAVAGHGLADLHSIGYAYRWLTENRNLVAMAVPQLAIDAHALPKLRLMVEHADRDAEMLRPILQNHLVEIHPFRRLNWSGRLGLLLEAA